MSVYGGDSWGREAQYRKRRVDDLIVDGLNLDDGYSYKKLSSGKYACLVCPHNPILDTPLMLSMHRKGSRHCAAESRLKERELVRHDEMNKRVALSKNSVATANSGTSTQQCRLPSKPLIERTRKAASEILCGNTTQQITADEAQYVQSTGGYITNEPSSSNSNGTVVEIEAAGEQVVQPQLDFRERRQRELKFTAAGWKRDCHGGWFRDENVEFDSDEEDPNVSLAR